MTLLATQPKPHPADPNKPWPGPKPWPSYAMARPDDMPVPTTPAPPPPPTPRPGVWKRVALAGVLGTAVTVAATLVLANAIRRLNLAVPLNSSEWLIGLVAFIGLVSQFATPSRRRPKQASPSVPSGTALAVDAPLRQRAVRAGLSLVRPPVRA